MTAVRLRDVSKSFGSHRAVDGLHFTVRRVLAYYAGLKGMGALGLFVIV
jgi:ABC-type uncharacterized transport system ATPase subunit